MFYSLFYLILKKGSENRDLVICNKCLWSVSLLKGSKVFHRCPMCNILKLESISVEDYENYTIEKSIKRFERRVCQ
jgi:hypothetical protein